jgi:HrpA-like RNA helicase
VLACTVHVVGTRRCEEPGDILVFLTGELEIETACTQIRSECAAFSGSETVGDVSAVLYLCIIALFSCILLRYSVSI